MKESKIIQVIKAGLAIFLVVIAYVMAPDSMPEAAQRQFAIFLFAALFWAFEIIPLYATSIIVVLLEIFFLCRPGGVLNMDETGYIQFLMPFGSSTVILFFGGLILAQAIQKYRLDQLIGARLIKLFGHSPYSLMIGFMVATGFLSMWMSNTAATALMMAMLIPLAKQLDEEDPFRKALVLSVPFSANIGGMATPVGTPPNAIGIGILAEQGIDVDFIQWMKMAFPLTVVILIVISFILYFLFPPKSKKINLTIPQQFDWNDKSKIVMLIAAMTVLLWLTSEFHKLPASVIALLSAGLFATFGLLDREDFKKIDWDVLVLMWGGLALGKGLEITGLTKWIIRLPIFAHDGPILVVVFVVFTVFISTFMSNTATANLVVPVAMAIVGGNKIFLAVTTSLACSLAMALPISTPPNAIAFASRMIKGQDMLKAGLLVSIISILIMLLGFNVIIPKVFKLP